MNVLYIITCHNNICIYYIFLHDDIMANIIIRKITLCQVTHIVTALKMSINVSIRFDSYRDKRESTSLALSQFPLDTFDVIGGPRSNGRPVTEDEVISAVNNLSPEERIQLSQMLELAPTQNLR